MTLKTRIGVSLILCSSLGGDIVSQHPACAPAAAAQTGDNDPRIELMRTIGDRSSADENFRFGIPTDLALDRDGRLFVVDSCHHRVQVFDREGRFVQTLGQKGDGPADFEYPYAADVDAEGRIYVSDLGHERVQIYDSALKHLRNLNVPAGALRLARDSRFVMGRAHGAFGYVSSFAGVGKSSDILFSIDSAGKVGASIVAPLEFRNGTMNGIGNEVSFDPCDDGHVWVAFRRQNRIEKYSLDGRLLLSRALRLDYQPTGPKPETEKSSEFREPRMNICSAGIAADGSGRIWIATLRRQPNEEERVGIDFSMQRGFDGKKNTRIVIPDYSRSLQTDLFRFDILSPQGDPLGSIPFDHFIDGVRILNNTLYVLDSFRGMKIYIYRIGVM